ncbi:MAG: 3-alpha,7-alpha,12-alpha-trihydroxy-5-beta-cholest-24-enoyl-CoA hydratase [Rhizobiales bacterium]|nr:3-alpha,7-alpha,12-alpha-trihydroxy-5-beta-cholest-24-enoyl-CoA hydratase [Hyphomicrobiales bacterium]
MPLNYERVLAHRPGPRDASTDERTCILYALGIGIGMDPTDAAQITFVHERELVAFPTLASVLGWPGRLTDPAFGIDARMVVAASLKVVLHRPLRTQETLTSDPRVVEIIDKGPGKHAILQSARTLVAKDGTMVATVENTSIARGHGGFGGRVTDTPEPPPAPERVPDAMCDLPTPPNLALIFRLMGDENPLHVDPESAKKSGFPRPILHGAATFGIAAHAVLRTCAGYEAARLAAIEARFSRPVFPGETIRTEMWQDGNDVAFRCRVVARDEIVLTNGLATLR